MSFIQRELDRVRAALLTTQDKETYDRLYVAQQALSWATEPDGFRSPYASVLDTQEGSEDYSADPHPALS